MGHIMSKIHKSSRITSITSNTILQQHTRSIEEHGDHYNYDNLGSRTREPIITLSSGIEVRSTSIESLRNVTENLLELNQDVVKVTLECKNDIWKNRALFNLVEEYLDNSTKTLDFCTSLDTRLKHARDSQLLISVALQQCEAKKGVGTIKIDKKMLKIIKSSRDQFTKEIKQILQIVLLHQTVILEKLHSKKAKLNKRLRKIHAWSKVSRVLFATTLISVLACSVVVAAIAAPPVAAALAAACSIPLGSMGKWVDSKLKKYENVMKVQKGVISSMEVGSIIEINDLKNIRTSIDTLEILIMEEWDLIDKKDGATFCVEKIKKKIAKFMKIAEELEKEVDICSRDIRTARTLILRRIIKSPNLNQESN
ncbi:UPF0496 protein At4g34320-like [Impatiens glandulifera]|uniref:UPF0496 protein At4g34320-like n=1 Tax=Impatiens glandulifera TaxID=253017 RepID=UPI001FB0F1A2|nr:UPF0496 protein At4g34320-like [Impatiens glandulifera]